MNAESLPWDRYQAFLAVVREGSLSRAARLLGVTQPTTRRHIESLETALGVVLFTRTPTGLQPTAAAGNVLPYAEALESAARAFVRHARESDELAAGTVRIGVSEMMGVEVLPPIVASLSRSHPGLALEVALSNRNEDLLRRDVDVAVRMVRPAQQGLVAKRARVLPFGLFATEDYLATHGAPTKPGELLSGHRLVGQDRVRTLLEGFHAAGLRATPSSFALRCDSDVGQLAFVRAGAGIGVCQTGVAARSMPPLVRVLPKVSFSLEAWVVMHEDLRASRRVRTVFDALVAGLESKESPSHESSAPRTRKRRASTEGDLRKTRK